jgi:hypothetical protein
LKTKGKTFQCLKVISKQCGSKQELDHDSMWKQNIYHQTVVLGENVLSMGANIRQTNEICDTCIKTNKLSGLPE